MALLCKPTAYKLHIYDQQDNLLDDLLLDRANAALEVEQVIAANEVGGLTLLLPGSLPESYFAWDNRLELRRSVCGGEFEIDGDQAWLISERRRVWKESAYMWLITALSGNWLLKRRIVAHKDKSAQADKTQKNPDDMMKDVVREQMVNGTDFFGTKTERVVAGLTVDANTSSVTPKIDKQFSARVVFDVVKEIADTSAEAGTWLGFDTIWTGSNFAFKVFATYRGVDRSEDLRISPEQGAIDEGELITSHIDAPSVVYAGGKGEGVARIIAPPVVNTQLVNASKYGWFETFYDTKQSDTLAKVKNEAQAAAKKFKPKRTLSLKLNDGVGATYGKDYRFGDLIGVLFDGQLVKVRVDGVRISLKKGKEEITVTLNEVDSQFQIATTTPTSRTTVVTPSTVAKQLAYTLRTVATLQLPNSTKPIFEAATFTNSWVNYGTPHRDATYGMDAAGAAVVQGVIKSGTLNTPAFTLPSELRPSSRMAFPAVSNGAIGRVNLHSDGTVVPEIGSNALYALDGIGTWRSDLTWTDVTFTNSWVNFGAPFFNGGYAVDEVGHVRIRGVIRNGTLNTPAFTLPAGMRPAARLAIATISNNGIGRVNIHTDGTVVPEINSNAFYMLDRLYVPRADLPFVNAVMQNSWVYFGSTFFEGSYVMDEIGYVHLRGVIKSGTLNTAAFTLPENMRPKSVLQFPTISNNAFGIIQVNTDGTVVPTINSNAFYMLDGIKFMP